MHFYACFMILANAHIQEYLNTPNILKLLRIYICTEYHFQSNLFLLIGHVDEVVDLIEAMSNLNITPVSCTIFLENGTAVALKKLQLDSCSSKFVVLQQNSFV